MKYGFEGLMAINLSGSPDSPVWKAIDEICDDVTFDDDSDEIEAGTRRHGGVKQTARGRISRGVTLPCECPDVIEAGDPLTADTAYAAMLGASRQRQAIVDVAMFDEYELDEESREVVSGSGIRMLAMVKESKGEPMGDRQVSNFELKPGRAHPVDQTDYVTVTPLNLAYTFEA